jgi:hypothetical protein
MLNDFANTIEYMDRILDQKYVYKSLQACEIILQFLLKNRNNSEVQKNLSDEFSKMQGEKVEKYKYKDIESLIIEIEKDIFTFSAKAQPYSNSKEFHLLGVKSFLRNERVLLALKSLLLLQQNYPTSMEYASALELFEVFIQNNSSNSKVNQAHIELVYSKISLLKNKSELKAVITKIYEEYLKLQKEEELQTLINQAIDQLNNGNVEDVLSKISKMENLKLRRAKSDTIIKLQLILTLFCSKEFAENTLVRIYFYK